MWRRNWCCWFKPGCCAGMRRRSWPTPLYKAVMQVLGDGSMGWLRRLSRWPACLNAHGVNPLLQVALNPYNRPARPARSEEHTSELQSLMRISYADFCLQKKIELGTCTDERCHKTNKNKQQPEHSDDVERQNKTL